MIPSQLRRSLPSLMLMVIRAGGLIARLVLSLFIVKFLDLEGVAVFGLLTAVVSIAPAMLSFGMNHFLNREIIGLSQAEAGARVRDRIVVSLIMSSLTVTIVALLGLNHRLGVLAESYWLIGILFALEVACNDLHMCLVSYGKAILAQLSLFVRSGLWIFVYVVLAWWFPDLRTLPGLCGFWLGGVVASLAIVVVWLYDWPWSAISQQRINLRETVRMREGSLWVYAGDLGNIVIQNTDRFLLSWLVGLETTGIFVFYWTFANGIHVLVYTAYIQTSLPRLVTAYRERGMMAWRKEMIHEIIQVTIMWLAIGTAVAVVLFVGVPFLGNEQLTAQLPFAVLLLVFALIRLWADMAGFGLYSLSCDKPYAASFLFGAVISPVLMIAGIQWLGLTGAAIALSLAWASVVLTRWYCLYSAFPQREDAGWLTQFSRRPHDFEWKKH